MFKYVGSLRHNDVGCASHFREGPIISRKKNIRDALNAKLLRVDADRIGSPLHCRKSRTKKHGKDVAGDEMGRLGLVRFTFTNYALGHLYLFISTQVKGTKNVAVSQSVVNGSRDTVVDILYDIHSSEYR